MKFFALSTVLMLGSLAPVSAVEPVMEINQLQRMAGSAQSAVEHSEVSRHFQIRAEHFEAVAFQHETEAKQLQAEARSPIAHKWPAFSGKPWVAEQRKAEQARQIASQSYAQSEKHLRLSVEALAEAADTRSARNTVR